MSTNISLNYNNKEYTVCQYKYNNKTQNKLYNILRYFIIDTDDLYKIKNYEWKIFNKYIGTLIDGQIILLHNLIMENDKIIHINKNIYDNRKKNLKIVSNYFKTKNDKNELPENCKIDINDIPKNVLFCKQNNNFISTIYYKDISKKYSSISSNIVSYEFKLEEIKAYLRYLRDNYEFFDELKYNDHTIKTIKSLKQFNNILIQSKVKNYKKSLVEIPDYIDLLEGKHLSNKEERKLLKNINKYFTIDCNFKLKISMNENKYIINDSSLIKNKYFIPKFCYYKNETEKRGDCFIIDWHPIISKLSGKRSISTSGSKKISTDDKYQELKQIFKKYKCKFE